MSEIVREMTLQEEIKSLPIDDSTKQRLLSKLKEYNYITEEHKALLAKTREEMYSKILPHVTEYRWDSEKGCLKVAINGYWQMFNLNSVMYVGRVFDLGEEIISA